MVAWSADRICAMDWTSQHSCCGRHMDSDAFPRMKTLLKKLQAKARQEVREQTHNCYAPVSSSYGVILGGMIAIPLALAILMLFWK